MTTPTALQTRLAASMAATATIRANRKHLQRASTVYSLYRNNPDGSAGLVFVGRINSHELADRSFPMKGNVSSAGRFKLPARHWIAKLLATIPNDPEQCKNIIIRVDKFGGAWRWSGFLHHWQVTTEDGIDYLTANFNDDMQVLQFLLGAPNPILPVSVFQFPRDWPQFGPAAWSIGVLILLNLIRKQAEEFVAGLINGVVTLIEDPFDLPAWGASELALLNPADWQVHVKVPSFLTDASLWTFIASRMNTVDSVIAAALDDAQLALCYRRVFTDEGEMETGTFGQPVANGALVFTIEDRSGFTLPGGTFFNGNAASGFVRSVLQWSDGYIEDTLTEVTDDESLYADEYWQSGVLGTFAAAPAVCLRDSWWNDLQSTVTWSPATAVSAIVGGDNPTADAIAKLIIESVGNLLGYFLLGGFDSAGDIAAEVIMPFLVGTIAAWDEVVNSARAKSLGWAHLFEVYQQGAENNAWSVAALAALRGAYNATDSQTSHQMVIDSSTWFIPGVHAGIKDRIGSTSGALQRMGVDMIFINQIEEMTLQADQHTGAETFKVNVGKNTAAMTTGERTAQQLKLVLDKLADIGVHLIS